MAREHPLGVVWHSEWEGVERRQAALRVADRKRRIVRQKPPLIDRIRIWIGECFG
ncbi:hypothetical protein KKHFBJBL_01713 [Brevundimonas sp. NIBR11]|nr:hypothetical protein KKHFBJBL_01713 [Brevundimonas sp. NIBR11]